MNGKISFGVDFVANMEVVLRKATPPIARLVQISFPVVRALLVRWGLSLDEIEQVMKSYTEGLNTNQLDYGQCVQRLADHLKDNDNEAVRQRLMTHMVTIAYLDLDYTDAQKAYVKSWGQDLNMSPSEINECALKGASFAHYLNQLGNAYAEYKIIKGEEK
jgi:hypothetical protein